MQDAGRALTSNENVSVLQQCIFGLESASLVFEHDRNAITHRIRKSIRPADEDLLRA